MNELSELERKTYMNLVSAINEISASVQKLAMIQNQIQRPIFEPDTLSGLNQITDVLIKLVMLKKEIDKCNKLTDPDTP